MSYAWIYNSFAQVEEYFEGKKKLLDPGINWDSLRLYSETGASLGLDLSVPEYKTALNSQEAVKVTKGSKTYTGLLVDTPSTESVRLAVQESPRKPGKSNIILVRDYDTLTYIGRGNEQTTLSGSSGSLVYRTSSLQWKAQGDLFLDKKGLLRYLSLYAVIDNRGDMHELQGGTLVSNYIPLQGSHPGVAMMRAPTSSGEGEGDSSLVYMTFPLETSLLDTGITLLPLLTYEIKKSSKVYLLDLQEGRSDARLGYFFTAPGKIPRATVAVQDENNMPLGEVVIQESQPGEEIEITLGKSSLITSRTRLTHQSIPVPDSDLSQKVISFTTTVTSYSEEKVTVALRYYIGQQKVLEASCEAEVKNGYLMYWLKMDPHTEQVVDCQFILDS